MIAYFKANDPYRLIGIFAILLIIRLPILLSGTAPIIPEIKWMLIGEKLGNGAIMYRDLWDDSAPLSVFVYKWLYLIFGKSRIPYLVLSIFLVIYQAGLFNSTMLNNKAYNQNTYVPALVYVIFMNAYFDFLTLSPVLMSMTFNLLAMRNLFKRMDNTTKDELFVFTGVFLGISTLFYLPSILFLIVTIVALLIHTGSILRRMLLLIYGYVIVLIIVGLFYYWNDAILHYHDFFFGSLWRASPTTYIRPLGLIVAAIVPLIVTVFSAVKMIQNGRYINAQVRIQYVMLLFLLSGVFAMLMIKDVSTFQLIYFVPPMAFFVAHYLLTIKNWILLEVTAIMIFTVLLFNHFFLANGWLAIDRLVSYEKLFSQTSQYQPLLMNKQVLIVGDDINLYVDASLATPFFNWQLSSDVLEHMNYYDNSSMVFSAFSDDLPEVIVDQQNAIPAIFHRLPTISNQYEEHSKFEGVYLKVD